MSEKVERAVKMPRAVEAESMTAIEREGLIRGGVTLVADASERLCVEGFGLIRDARTETFARVQDAFAWVDGTQQALVRFARGAVSRVDSVLEGTLGATEAGLVGSVRMIRNAAHSMTDVASRATAAMTGKGETQATVRAA
jgi:hypothetical protein